MRLTVIGCSGSFPGPDSPASCYLLEAEDADGRNWRVVIDLGNGALGPLQRHGDLRDLDAVLISHLHPDHFMDLCGLFVALHYHPDGMRAAPLPVFGPSDTADRVVAAYGSEAPEAFLKVYDVQPWADGATTTIGPFTITSRLVEHPVEAYGLRIEHADGVVVYSGDTDSCAGLQELAAGADLYLCEAAFQDGRDPGRGIHLTGGRAGESATEAGVARLVLTHIPPWTDGATVLASARATYAGPAEVAAAGAVYPVDGASVGNVQEERLG